MSTITSGGVDITASVSEYESTRTSGNRVHKILNRDNPSATLRVAGLRTGRLTLTFGNELDSSGAENIHAEAGRVFLLDAPERPTVGMYYVVADEGDITRRLEDTGQWTLTIDFQEVSPT